jgi:hypothetical protein
VLIDKIAAASFGSMVVGDKYPGASFPLQKPASPQTVEKLARPAGLEPATF